MPTRNSSGSGSRLAQLVLLTVVLLVAVTAVVGASLRVRGDASVTGSAQQAAVPATLEAPASRPTLLIIGDSFAGGTGNPDFDVYPQVLAEMMGWNVRVDAQGGTGFVNTGLVTSTGPKTVPLIDRLDADRERYNSDFILVDAGRNDLGIDPGKVSSAIGTYFDRLQEAFPKARKAIVIPAYVTPTPAVNYPTIRDALLAQAKKYEADVMDPVAEGWYVGVDLPSMLGSDGVHFNGKGNEFYAEKISGRLRDFGYPVGNGQAG